MRKLYECYRICGDNVPYIIGFPSPNSSTINVEALDSYAIFSESKVKECAWEFLKFLIGESYITYDIYMNHSTKYIESVNRYGYSSIRERCKAQLDTDQSMVYCYNTRTGYCEVYGNGSEPDRLYLPEDYLIVTEYPKELRRLLDELIYNTTTPQLYYPEITEMIGVELTHYFDDKKTLDEVLGTINARAEQILNGYYNHSDSDLPKEGE
nr:hypothetical protein [Clostridia bacterium]